MAKQRKLMVNKSKEKILDLGSAHGGFTILRIQKPLIAGKRERKKEWEGGSEGRKEECKKEKRRFLKWKDNKR